MLFIARAMEVAIFMCWSDSMLGIRCEVVAVVCGGLACGGHDVLQCATATGQAIVDCTVVHGCI